MKNTVQIYDFFRVHTCCIGKALAFFIFFNRLGWLATSFLKLIRMVRFVVQDGEMRTSRQ